MTQLKRVSNAHGLHPFEAQVLSIIQSRFPIEERPYQALADQLSTDEQTVFDCVCSLKEKKIIRRLGAIFDANHLGYTSALCAISVPDEDAIDRVVEFINHYHNVTHNYERPGHYNIWFTLITPSLFEARIILQEIAQTTGYDDILHLPTKRLFKIRVDFSVTSSAEAQAAGKSTSAAADVASSSTPYASTKKPFIDPSSIVPEAYSNIDKALVRVLQKDLSGSLDPFGDVARATHGVDDFEFGTRAVLQRVRNWKFNGTIRRFGAAVRHHRVGYSCNAMCVWDIPDELVVEAATILASRKAVSHCYERPRKETWPANVYTMVHGQTTEQCEAVVDEMMADLAAKGMKDAIARPTLLYSTREFKKVSMRYFMEGLNNS